MNKLFRLLKPHMFLFVLALVALLLSSLSNAALTGMITPLMDEVFTNSPSETESKAESIFGFKEKLESIQGFLENDLGFSFDSLNEAGKLDLVNPLPWALLAFLIFCTQALFDFVGTYALGRIGVKIIVNMRQDLIEKVVFLSMNFYKKFSTGEILTRINSDVVRIQNAVSVKLGELFREIANTFVFLALAFTLDWKLSLTLFILVPLVGIPISVLTRKIRRYASQSQTVLGALTGHLKEVLVGIRIVKGFQKEGFEAKRLEAQNHRFMHFALRELRIVAMTTPIMSLIGMVVILSFVWYGGVMIQAEQKTRGDFLLYLLAIYQLYQPIKRIARANSEIQSAVGVIPRIEEILEQDNDIIETPSPQRFPSWPEPSRINFEAVSFHYNKPDEPVLKSVDLEINQGSVVALVGPSGSGKSTLVNLLPRYFDVVEGAITIDGIDIRKMAKQDLRALFAVVTQDTILFDDSVHNNIAYGMPHISREEVIEAARKAHAHQFISQFPKGYETFIGEAGGNLSGGQRQRISIARAILKNAPILILDEATSALDTESEREVQAALEGLMRTKTTLVIAHRLSTIRQASEIIVLEAGQIVERGDHDSLVKTGGLYSKLIEMQKEGHHAL